jgi:hypothetical protein
MAVSSILRAMVAWLLVSGLVVSSALAGVHQCVPPAGAAALDTVQQGDTPPDELPGGGCGHACRCVCHHHNIANVSTSPLPTLSLAADLFPAAPSAGVAITPSPPRRPPKL